MTSDRPRTPFEVARDAEADRFRTPRPRLCRPPPALLNGAELGRLLEYPLPRNDTERARSPGTWRERIADWLEWLGGKLCALCFGVADWVRGKEPHR